MHCKTFPASLNYLHSMLNFIQEFDILQSASSPFLNKIILASEEVLINIIDYAYPNQEGDITITCCAYKEEHKTGIEIQIIDNGISFNPMQNKKKEKEIQFTFPSTIGGHGIQIFIEVMDKVSYQRIQSKNYLSLIKYF